MITEPFLCDEYFLRYHQKCKAEQIHENAFWEIKKSKSLKVNTIVQKLSNQTFKIFLNPVKVWFEGVLRILLTFRDFDFFYFSKSWQTWLFIVSALPYIFDDISKSIHHTEMVQLSSESWHQDVSNEWCIIAVR